MKQVIDHNFRTIKYQEFWRHYPPLESILVTEWSQSLAENYDADFLGINRAELKIWWKETDESLEKMNKVPCRMCIQTMRSKKCLCLSQILEVFLGGEPVSLLMSWRWCDAFVAGTFLSKLQPILAV